LLYFNTRFNSIIISVQAVQILLLHCDNIEYTPTKKEIKSAEEITPETKQFKEIVVAFAAFSNSA